MGQEFKNFDIGGIKLVALADVPNAPAATAPNTALLVGLSQDELARVTAEDMANSINMFVLKTGKGNYLFDTGLGEDGPRKGEMIASLKSAGFEPGDIDGVVLTHFHPDHIGGLVKGGNAVFPKATLYVGRMEVEKGPQVFDKFSGAYEGRTVRFEWGDEIVPGVKAFEAAGHTNGHSVFLVENAGDRLLIMGDLIHFGGVQLPRPEIAVTYDTDPAAAVAARKRVFAMAAEEGIPVASMHLRFPGVGKLAKAGEGYSFTVLP